MKSRNTTTKHWSKQCLEDLHQYEYKPWSAVPSMRGSKAGRSPSRHAQELQRLFQRAYPNAVRGNTDAQEMGQAVLSSRWSHPRKIAYLEGVSFSELWQKARFEEARLRDLESSAFTNPVSRKYQGPTSERHREENTTPPFRPNQTLNRESTRQLRPGERNQTILCYKCHQPGHVARNCRQGTRFSEAPGRQSAPRTAAVTPDKETVQQGAEGSDTSEEPLTWMYGVHHVSQDGESSKESTCSLLCVVFASLFFFLRVVSNGTFNFRAISKLCIKCSWSILRTLALTTWRRTKVHPAVLVMLQLLLLHLLNSVYSTLHHLGKLADTTLRSQIYSCGLRWNWS